MSSRNTNRRRRRVRRAPNSANAVRALAIRQEKYDLGLEAPILTPLRVGATLRYYFTTVDGSVASVYPLCLLNLFGVTKTTTTFCSVIEAVKLNKIKLFLPGRISTDATSASSTNSLKLSVRDAMIPGIGVEKDITIATTGAKGRYFEYRPRGFAAEWYNYDAVTTFATDVPIFVVAPSIGTTAFVEIDVGVQFTVASSVGAAAALCPQTTVDTTSAGAFCFCYLDSVVDADTEGSQILAPFYSNAVTANMPKPLPVVSSSSGPPARLLPRFARA